MTPPTPPSEAAREAAEHVETYLDIADEPAASLSRRDAIARALDAHAEAVAGELRAENERMRAAVEAARKAISVLHAQPSGPGDGLCSTSDDAEAQLAWVELYRSHVEGIDDKLVAALAPDRPTGGA